jgi:hypothetical protein
MLEGWRRAAFAEVAMETLPADHGYQTTWWRRIRGREARRPLRLRARAAPVS